MIHVYCYRERWKQSLCVAGGVLFLRTTFFSSAAHIGNAWTYNTAYKLRAKPPLLLHTESFRARTTSQIQCSRASHEDVRHHVLSCHFLSLTRLLTTERNHEICVSTEIQGLRYRGPKTDRMTDCVLKSLSLFVKFTIKFWVKIVSTPNVFLYKWITHGHTRGFLSLCFT